VASQDSSIPRVVSALTARTQLGQIMRRAVQRRERFLVDRRGRPQVVIMGFEDFLRTIAPPARVVENMRAAARRSGASALRNSDIDREIRLARQERHLLNAGTKRRP